MVNVKALAAFLTESRFMFLTNSNRLTVRMFSTFHFISPDICSRFTPLESPSIYAGDGRNRKHQLLIEGGVKPLPFLTGFILLRLLLFDQLSTKYLSNHGLRKVLCEFNVFGYFISSEFFSAISSDLVSCDLFPSS